MGVYKRVCKTCGKEFETRGDFTLECTECQSKIFVANDQQENTLRIYNKEGE